MTSGTDTTTLSRRAALAASASAALVSPAGASAIDPDYELRDLNRLYRQTLTAADAAEARADSIYEAMQETAPVRPAALKIQPMDWAFIGTSPRHKLGTYIETGEIDRVREFTGFNRKAYESCGVNKGSYERGLEVIAAHDEWHTKYLAHREASGLNEAQSAADDYFDAASVLEKRILGLRAHTIAGLRVKAQIAKRHHFGGDHESIGSLLDDLVEDA